ncbi:MAG: tetratricopeptide repeat protein [Thermoanaerobaculaceae bacterium]
MSSASLHTPPSRSWQPRPSQLRQRRSQLRLPPHPPRSPSPVWRRVAEMEGGPPEEAVLPEAPEPPVPPLAPVEEPPPPSLVAEPAEQPVLPVTLIEEPPPPSLVAVPAELPVAPPDAEPPASLTLARLYLRQQQPGAAVDVLETLVRREPDNQEARELLGLVRDMLDVAPAVTTPTLTPGERRIASLQRWLARVQAGRERIAP